MLLHGMPGGGRAFELVARFCYRGGWIEIRPDNVALLQCAAEYLDMSEEFGNGNLLQSTRAYLSTIPGWTRNGILTLLNSCDSLLPFAEKSGIIQLCVDSLALRAKSRVSCCSPIASSNGSPNPCSMSPSPKPSPLILATRSSKTNRESSQYRCKSPILNQRFSCPCSPDTWCGTPVTVSNSVTPRCNSNRNWWSEDMSFLSMYMMKRVVSALVTQCVDNKFISRVLLRYLEASLPLLGYSPLSVVDGRICANVEHLKESAHRVQREVLETVVHLLYHLDWASVPMKCLFELRRVSTSMVASYKCRQQIEEMIGSQLHRATLDNILTPRVKGADCRSCLYDVDLVLRLLNYFLHGETVSKLHAGFERNGGIDHVGELEVPCGYGRSGSKLHAGFERNRGINHVGELEARYGYGGSVHLTSLRMVGKLIDKYLAEIAPDTFLEASKFSELAESLPKMARSSYDGLYRALDIYLQAHPKIPNEDVMRICGVIDFEKLSFEACKHVMENPRIPACFSFQVIAAQQEKLRLALGSSGHDPSKRQSFEDGFSIPAIAAEYACVVKQNEELRCDLRNMQSKIDELERLCKGLRSQMSQEVWLTC
ncbi:hypothetical protein KP509_23G041000 [Ceratopteris richardii]|nr:hypothetical protein KP509_23G041000 [Ceratopteris richardii]